MRALTRYAFQLPQPSARPSLAAGYFRLGAALGAAGLAVAAGKAIAGAPAMRASLFGHPLGWGLAVLMVAGWWRTGTLLDRRRREGAWLALAAFALPLVAWSLGAASLGASAAVTNAVGVGVVLSSWNELR